MLPRAWWVLVAVFSEPTDACWQVGTDQPDGPFVLTYCALCLEAHKTALQSPLVQGGAVGALAGRCGTAVGKVGVGV